MKHIVQLSKIKQQLKLQVGTSLNKALDKVGPDLLASSVQFMHIIQKENWEFIGTSLSNTYNYLMFDTAIFYSVKNNRQKNILYVETDRNIDIEEYVNSSFESLSNDKKDRINNEYLDVSALFESPPTKIKAYVHPPTDSIIVFTDDEMSKNLKNLILLTLSVSSEEIPDELTEMLNNGATDKDWTNYFLRQQGTEDDPINKFFLHLKNSALESLEKRYKSYLDQYQLHLSDMEKTLKYIDIIKEEIISLPENMDEEKNYMKDVASLEQIIDISVKTGGRTKQLKFDILTELQVDEEFVNNKILRNKEVLNFFKDLIEGKIIVRVGNNIKISLNDGNITLGVEDMTYRDLLNGDGVIYPNPHLLYNHCFGTYKHQILDAIRTKNIYAASLSMIKSTSELNLVDSIVKDQFIENIYRNGEIMVYVPHMNEHMSYNKYRKIEREQTQNEENTN